MEIIASTLIGILILFLIFQQTRLIYNRYLRTYKKEILEFLNNKGFEYIDTVVPNDTDWLKSPFSKPQKIRIDFLLIKIGGPYISWTTNEYLKIIGRKKEKFQEFWIEIKTTYFQKPNLSILEGQLIKTNETDYNQEIKVIIVREKCPACGFKISESDKLCPDCGLNFE